MQHSPRPHHQRAAAACRSNSSNGNNNNNNNNNTDTPRGCPGVPGGARRVGGRAPLSDWWSGRWQQPTPPTKRYRNAPSRATMSARDVGGAVRDARDIGGTVARGV